MREPIFSARALVKRYGRVIALDHADFDLLPGEILAIVGDNGAGKSSLIKALSGAAAPTKARSGWRTRRAFHVAARSARRGHRDRLPDARVVAGAIDRRQPIHGARAAQGRCARALVRMLDHAAMERLARDELAELGLQSIQDIRQRVETLSGGQRQGVAVARAVAFGSKVVILDEPTAALGVKESRKVLDLLLTVRARGVRSC